MPILFFTMYFHTFSRPARKGVKIHSKERQELQTGDALFEATA